MKAVVIGPGRIGCGFAGELLHSSGYDLTFVARKPEVVRHLNRVGRYRVKLTSTTEQREQVIGPVRALWTQDTSAVSGAIAEANVIATAVGPQNLALVAPILAAGLERRRSRPTSLAFENLINAGSWLRRLVRNAVHGANMAEDHGFSGALVKRAVTQKRGSIASDEPLEFIGDTPSSFVVDATSLKKPFPKIKGMVTTKHFTAWALGKLYVFSAGHATAAYLGSLKGYHYIHSAVRDPEIRAAVLAAMREGQRGLEAKFGWETCNGDKELEEIMARFENALLSDPIQRVGRDPRRKLGPKERLVGAARLAERAGVVPESLVLATAAALCFCDPEDPSCTELNTLIRNSGAGAVLEKVCGLDQKSELASSVLKSWGQLAPGWQPGNQLVSLERRMWAWG